MAQEADEIGMDEMSRSAKTQGALTLRIRALEAELAWSEKQRQQHSLTAHRVVERVAKLECDMWAIVYGLDGGEYNEAADIHKAMIEALNDRTSK
jgi:hypothetical protein